MTKLYGCEAFCAPPKHQPIRRSDKFHAQKSFLKVLLFVNIHKSQFYFNAIDTVFFSSCPLMQHAKSWTFSATMRNEKHSFDGFVELAKYQCTRTPRMNSLKMPFTCGMERRTFPTRWRNSHPWRTRVPSRQGDVGECPPLSSWAASTL